LRVKRSRKKFIHALPNKDSRDNTEEKRENNEEKRENNEEKGENSEDRGGKCMEGNLRQEDAWHKEIFLAPQGVSHMRGLLRRLHP